MAKKALKDIFLKFVSVVDKGDNPEAKIMLFKSAEEDKEIIKEKGGQGKMVKTFDEIIKGLPADEAEVINGQVKKVQEDLEKAMVKPADCSQADWDAADFAGKLKIMAESKVPAVKKEDKSNDDTLIEKADPAVAEIIKKLQEKVTQTEGALKKEQEDLKKEREDLKKEKLVKQVGTYDKISAPTEELVDLFMKQEPEDAVKLDAIFKAVNTQLSDGTVFKTVGQNAGGEQKTAMEKAEALATVRADEKKISKALAFAEILKENPGLYDEYNKEV